MTSALNLLMVAAGGAIGSLARYLITLGSEALPWGSNMLGTTIANLIGCAAIGAFAEYVILREHLSEELQLAVRVGALGGLTTFSSFAYEAIALADEGRWGVSGLYLMANLFLGFSALIIATMMVRGWLA